MDLNTILISILSIPFLYLGYLYVTQPKLIIPEKPRFLWGEQVGKTKQIQSKTGDASMATELSRRRAIQQAGRLDKSKLKESRTSSGSTTGAFETFFLSSICPLFCSPCAVLPPTIYDAGGVDADYCSVLDGEDETSIFYDGGGINTLVCGV